MYNLEDDSLNVTIWGAAPDTVILLLASSMLIMLHVAWSQITRFAIVAGLAERAIGRGVTHCCIYRHWLTTFQHNCFFFVRCINEKWLQFKVPLYFSRAYARLIL